MDRPTRTAALSAALLGGALATALVPAVAGAQARGLVAPRWRFEAAAVIPEPTYAEDGAGGGVYGGLAPTLGATAVWQAGRRGIAEVGLRASSSSISVQTGGTARDAGRALQLDLVAGLGLALGDRVALRGGGGLSMLRGDDAVAPFRAGNDSPWHLAGEGGLLVRLARTRPIGLALTGHFMRLGAAAVEDPVAEGTLTRFIVGVTYGG